MLILFTINDLVGCSSIRMDGVRNGALVVYSLCLKGSLY
jgi:hypothetical protein